MNSIGQISPLNADPDEDLIVIPEQTIKKSQVLKFNSALFGPGQNTKSDDFLVIPLWMLKTTSKRLENFKVAKSQCTESTSLEQMIEKMKNQQRNHAKSGSLQAFSPVLNPQTVKQKDQNQLKTWVSSGSSEMDGNQYCPTNDHNNQKSLECREQLHVGDIPQPPKDDLSDQYQASSKSEPSEVVSHN